MNGGHEVILFFLSRMSFLVTCTVYYGGSLQHIILSSVSLRYTLNHGPIGIENAILVHIGALTKLNIALLTFGIVVKNRPPPCFLKK